MDLQNSMPKKANYFCNPSRAFKEFKNRKWGSLNKEQDPEQVEAELEEPSASEPDESVSGKQEPYVDQEMADEYGFTPQQAKAMGMFL